MLQVQSPRQKTCSIEGGLQMEVHIYKEGVKIAGIKIEGSLKLEGFLITGIKVYKCTFRHSEMKLDSRLLCNAMGHPGWPK